MNRDALPPAGPEIPDDDPRSGWAAISAPFPQIGAPDTTVSSQGEYQAYRLVEMLYGLSPRIEPKTFTVDRLAHYDDDCRLDAVLVRFNDRIYDGLARLVEVPGRAIVVVRPDRRHLGLGLAICRVGDRLWNESIVGQSATPGGVAIAAHIAADREARRGS
jgi:hypothetical protein